MTNSQPTAPVAEAPRLLVDDTFDAYDVEGREGTKVQVRLAEGDTMYEVTIVGADGRVATAVLPNRFSGPYFALAVASAAHHAG